MIMTELEVFPIFVWILIFSTVQNCTVLNITKDLRILADKLGKFNKNLEQSMNKSGFTRILGNSGFSLYSGYKTISLGIFQCPDDSPNVPRLKTPNIHKFEFPNILMDIPMS